MSTQTTFRTVEDILAAGHAALNFEKAEAARTQAEYEARIDAICKIALSVAKQYIPVPLHPYLRPVFDFPYSVHVHIEIPNATPVITTLRNKAVTGNNIDDPDFDVPANWNVFTNGYHDAVFIWDAYLERHVFSGSFDDLPRALVFAQQNYRKHTPAQPVEPIPQPDPTADLNFYQRLQADLNEVEEGDASIPLKAIARALIDIAESLNNWEK